MPRQHLSDRTILAVGGDDRLAFLQGLITNDAMKLASGEPLYAALLSPQGKFLHDFFLVPHGDTIWLDVNKDRAADLQARLGAYKLRSKVTIAAQPDIIVSAGWADDDTPAGAIRDPRLDALGWRHYGAALAGGGDYEAHRIRLGIPDGAKDMHIDKSLLLEFGFEFLNGVSFSKGCYVGQEVTARSKFRGQVRRSLYRVQADAPLPACGTEVTKEGVNAGEIRSVSDRHGLALLRSEELEKSTAPLMAQGIEIRYERPSWYQ